jgi:predicted lipoprotein with Yx(FWY)xxD motif
MTPPACTRTRIQPGTRTPARLGLMAASLAAVVLLAGCGGSSNKATTGTTTATTASGATTPAATASVVAVNHARLGAIVADSGGETLYVFDGDTPGKIGCTGSCATLWLPVVLELGQASPTGSGVTGALATVDRAEGPQVTLAGRPLYTYTKDAKPGDTNGDGVGGKWHVAKPAGNPVGATSATTARGTTTTASGYHY